MIDQKIIRAATAVAATVIIGTGLVACGSVEPAADTTTPTSTPTATANPELDALHAQQDAELAAAAGTLQEDICAALLDKGDTPTITTIDVYVPADAVSDRRVRAAVASTCPQNQWIVDMADTNAAAHKGDALTAIDGGTYVVGNGAGQMLPGTWKTTTTRELYWCYWERTDTTGEIILNLITETMTKDTVTVHDGETFMSERCGAWEKTG